MDDRCGFGGCPNAEKRRVISERGTRAAQYCTYHHKQVGRWHGDLEVKKV